MDLKNDIQLIYDWRYTYWEKIMNCNKFGFSTVVVFLGFIKIRSNSTSTVN